MAIDPTKARIDALGPSPLPLQAPNRYEIDVANTPLRHCMSGFVKSVGALRDASQRHDGKMTPPAAMLDTQFDHRAETSSNERMRRGTGRSTRQLGQCLQRARPVW